MTSMINGIELMMAALCGVKMATTKNPMMQSKILKKKKTVSQPVSNSTKNFFIFCVICFFFSFFFFFSNSTAQKIPAADNFCLFAFFLFFVRFKYCELKLRTLNTSTCIENGYCVVVGITSSAVLDVTTLRLNMCTKQFQFLRFFVFILSPLHLV